MPKFDLKLRRQKLARNLKLKKICHLGSSICGPDSNWICPAKQIRAAFASACQRNPRIIQDAAAIAAPSKKRQQVRVNLVRVSRRHTMRKSRIAFQCAVLQEFRGLLGAGVWPKSVTYVVGTSPLSMRPGRTHTVWRRRRDSNPRDPFGSNGFQDRRFQPLTHSSVDYSTLLGVRGGTWKRDLGGASLSSRMACA